MVFNLADFHNSSNQQNKFYAKFSSYTVCIVFTASVQRELKFSVDQDAINGQHILTVI